MTNKNDFKDGDSRNYIIKKKRGGVNFYCTDARVITYSNSLLSNIYYHSIKDDAFIKAPQTSHLTNSSAMPTYQMSKSKFINIS